MKIVLLTKPLRRRLKCTDRQGRRYFIEISPEGLIEVWLSRLKREQTSIQAVYERSVVLRKAAEKLLKKKGVTNGRQQ